ncbi:hypothetical protein [Alkalinema sp. FACHB-956]|uniref:hypothetical protein n=1 Tax=Alkalinema sp. FACHB-956 TaxID=2692768 RepID=UPI001689F413|nr:hypothetical protein [Alkalinema sp. FACHB-956]MBD2329538.1 hypothetical protein [Alkalinema sp. FACHB-956]
MPQLVPPSPRWRKFLLKAAAVVTTEVVLNAVGLDTLANYVEFLENHSSTVSTIAETVSNWITFV